MSLRGFISKPVAVPRGSWGALLNRRKGTPARASMMQNCRIRFGTVRSRPGTAAVFAAIDKVTSIFNWITPADQNMVLYQDGSDIKAYNQALATSTDVYSAVGARAASFAPLNVWLYFCGFNTSGNGVYPTQICSFSPAGVPQVDTAFRPKPDITAWTAADGGAGYCTQGQHFIGFVYQNRTGYAGVPVTSISYTITATTNGSPDVLTAPGNNLQIGQQVTISGSTGDTAINGTRLVAAAGFIAGSTFSLTDTDGNAINGNGAYAGSGVVTNPIQFTTTAGLRQINISVTLPPQLDGGTSANGGVQATLFLIATRADNPATWYFIPTDAQTGQVGEQAVPLNAAVTLNFVFSLSDEDIANSLAGDTAQKNFLFLTQGSPDFFNPSFVVAYGQRMCYGAGTTLFVSDINNPQQIALDTNEIRMQNQRKIAAAFQLPGNPNLYLTGDHWTGYVTDNSDSPSTWGEPVGVSDALGAMFPDHICSATGGNYVWIVTESGPYYFDGQYTSNQLLYLVTGLDENERPTGWNRVNWGAAYTIQIRDDVANLKLYIAVPLDNSPEPNYMFVIDYRMGKTFETVDIGLDLFNPALFSAIGVVKEYASGRSNLWIGPSAAGNVVHFNVFTHNDQNNAVHSRWQSGSMFGTEVTTSMQRIGYLDIWARGNAPLAPDGSSTFGLEIISQDSQFIVEPELQSQMGVPAALVEQPGITYSAKFDLTHVSDCTVAFETNAVDSWFELSAFTLYHRPDLSNR